MDSCQQMIAADCIQRRIIVIYNYNRDSPHQARTHTLTPARCLVYINPQRPAYSLLLLIIVTTTEHFFTRWPQ